MYCLETLVTKDANIQLAMWKKVTLPLQGIFLKYLTISFVLFILPPSIDCVPARAVLLNAEPVEAIDVRRVFYGPYQHLSKRKSPNLYPPLHAEDYYYEPSFSESDSFSIQPEDAVSQHKYSPPVYPQNSGFPTYPSQTDLRRPSPKRLFVPGSHAVSSESQLSGTVNLKPVFFSPSILISETFITEATVTSDFKVSGSKVKNTNNSELPNKNHPQVNATSNTHFIRNNFTDTNDSHASVSSDTVFKYQPPPLAIPKNNRSKNESIKYDITEVPNVTHPEVQVSVATEVMLDDGDMMLNDAPEVPDGTETSDPLDQDSISLSTVPHTTDNKVTLTPTVHVEEDNSSVVPPVGSTKQYKFSSGAVAGIVIAVLTCVTVVTSSVIYLLYRKYNGQCTSVVESKFNSDNCGYLDDSLRSSVYLNNHIELPKENSEEMTSLDNDSFLNSLETMTIQNYWADSTKNTKV